MTEPALEEAQDVNDMDENTDSTATVVTVPVEEEEKSNQGENDEETSTKQKKKEHGDPHIKRNVPTVALQAFEVNSGRFRLGPDLEVEKGVKSVDEPGHEQRKRKTTERDQDAQESATRPQPGALLESNSAHTNVDVVKSILSQSDSGVLMEDHQKDNDEHKSPEDSENTIKVPLNDPEAGVVAKPVPKRRLKQAPGLSHIKEAMNCCTTATAHGGISVGVVVTISVTVTFTAIFLLFFPICFTVGVCNSEKPGVQNSTNLTTSSPTLPVQRVNLAVQNVDILGWSVSLSHDGNTLLTGSASQELGASYCYIFTKTPSGWSPPTRLNVTGGLSVAISGDGNTAIVGNDGVWFFKRQGEAWVKDGPRWFRTDEDRVLYPTPSPGGVHDMQFEYETLLSRHYRQIYSVAISGDGSIALVGGGNITVLWRQGYSQQWTLAGSLSHTALYRTQSISVAISYDGQTGFAMALPDDSYGIPDENDFLYVFDVNDLSSPPMPIAPFVPILAPLVGGISLAGRPFGISADGRTAAYNRFEFESVDVLFWDGGGWIAQGTNLTCGRNPFALALSADGNTLLINGYHDNFEYEGPSESEYINIFCQFTRQNTQWTRNLHVIKTIGYLEDGGVDIALGGPTGNIVAIGNVNGTVLVLPLPA